MRFELLTMRRMVTPNSRQLRYAVPAEIVASYLPRLRVDAASVTCLRSVFMKPEHRDWLDPIIHILEASAAA